MARDLRQHGRRRLAAEFHAGARLLAWHVHRLSRGRGARTGWFSLTRSERRKRRVFGILERRRAAAARFGDAPAPVQRLTNEARSKASTSTALGRDSN